MWCTPRKAVGRGFLLWSAVSRWSVVNCSASSAAVVSKSDFFAKLKFEFELAHGPHPPVAASPAGSPTAPLPLGRCLDNSALQHTTPSTRRNHGRTGYAAHGRLRARTIPPKPASSWLQTRLSPRWSRWYHDIWLLETGAGNQGAKVGGHRRLTAGMRTGY